METLNQIIIRLDKTVAALESRVAALESKKAPQINIAELKRDILSSLKLPEEEKIDIAEQIKAIVTEKFISNLYRNKNG